MNIVTYLRSIWTRIVTSITTSFTATAATPKPAQAITVAVRVDAADALAALEGVSSRVREFRAEVEQAMTAIGLFELKAQAWAESKAKAAVAEVKYASTFTGNGVVALYADGERVAGKVVAAIQAAAVDTTTFAEAIPAAVEKAL